MRMRNSKVAKIIEEIKPDILEDIQLEKARQTGEKIAQQLQIQVESPAEITLDLTDFTIERRAELQRVFLTKAWCAATAMVEAIMKKLRDEAELKRVSIKDLAAALKDLASVIKELKLKVEDNLAEAIEKMSDEELEKKIIELKQQSITIKTEPKTEKEPTQVIDVQPEKSD